MGRVEIHSLQFEPLVGENAIKLRECDEPHRILLLGLKPMDSTAIELAMDNVKPYFPLAHEIMAGLVDRLGGRLVAAVLDELRHDLFVAYLALSGPAGDQRLYTRPADAIALAVRLGAPIEASAGLLDMLGYVPRPDDEDERPKGPKVWPLGTIAEEYEIEEEVEKFRRQLPRIDPDDFLYPPPPGYGVAENDPPS